MATVFERAPRVAPGDPITSRQLAKFAKAWNDRLPLFDFAWRIAWWFHGLFRSVRNGDAEGYRHAPWPEYHYTYQSLEPGQGSWPIAGPGEPEGFNLATPFGAYVWGSAGANLYDESGRFSDVPMAIDEWGNLPATARDKWELRKRQCGAVNLATGEASAPAWTAARSWYLTYGGPRSPHGNSYGGYLPSPAVLGVCEDPDLLDGIPAPPNEEVVFTATDAGLAAGLADKVYAGNCPIGPSTTEDYSAHVWGIWRTPWAFYVVLNSGTMDVLPTWAYVEGPYSGVPRLRRTEGGQLIRALAAFAACHRGPTQNDVARSAVEAGAAQKATSWLVGAFKHQEFFQQQYVLAPLRGGTAGDGSVVPLVPVGHAGTGSVANCPPQTLVDHTVALNCTVRYALVEAVGSEDAFTEFEVEVAGRIQPVRLPSAEGSRIVRVNAGPGVRVVVRLANHARAKWVIAELSEAIEYKPDISDLILLQRLVGDPESGLSLDASRWLAGVDADGCVLNLDGRATVQTPAAAVTDHPAYEPIRRWSRCVRLLPADSIVGYALEDGKSVIWFRRYARWTGRAPERTEVFELTDAIQTGREYLVEATGTEYVSYGAELYYNGEHFVGLTETDFVKSDPSVRLWEIAPGTLDPMSGGDLFSGIAEQVTRTAPRQGFTNRWVIGWQFRPRHPSGSSIWKESAYGDIFGFNDRGAFYSPEIANEITKQMVWMVAFGQAVPGPYGGNVLAEMPTGYRYARMAPMVAPWSSKTHLNQITVGDYWFATTDDRDRFHKSVRIYEPDLEIESAEAVTEDGQELVKVTLTGRLHTDETAPATVDRDVTTWDLDALQAAPYQTSEHALMTHVARLYTGRNFTAIMGDNAAHSRVQENPDNPYTTDYPMAYLVKMIPEPYVDANDRQDVSDTPFFHDMVTQTECYAMACCNGCVDHQQNLDRLIEATEDNGGNPPTDWGLTDYSYSSLCLQAFGGSWVGLMPTEATPYIPAARTRPDMPQGFGPLPNMDASAEVFNRLCAQVDLLNRFRIMLPWVLERWETWYETFRPAAYIPYSCNYPTGLTYAHSDGEKFPVASTQIYDDGAWVEDSVAEARAFGRLTANLSSEWLIDTVRVDVRWRISLTDGIEYALPPYVQELWDDGQVGLLTWNVRSYSNSKRTEADPGDPGAYLDSGTGLWWTFPHGSVDVEERYPAFSLAGLSVPPALPQPSDTGFYFDGVGPGYESPGGSDSYLGTYAVPGETMFVEVPLTDTL